VAEHQLIMDDLRIKKRRHPKVPPFLHNSVQQTYFPPRRIYDLRRINATAPRASNVIVAGSGTTTVLL
jgi:hypothetical protein